MIPDVLKGRVRILKLLLRELTQWLPCQLDELAHMIEDDVQLSGLRHTKLHSELFKRLLKVLDHILIIRIQCETKCRVYGVSETIQAIQEGDILNGDDVSKKI